MFQHEPLYEGAAAMWPQIRCRICASLMVYQARTHARARARARPRRPFARA